MTGEVELHALVRRPTGRCAERWHEHVAAPGEWPALAASMGGEVAVSTLGTTMRAAGSKSAFRAIDLDLVAAFAAAAGAGGVARFITVSSVGADPDSRNFYLRIKGEAEAALAAIGFDRLDVVRPGLLRGERGADRRAAERLAIRLSPVTNLLLRGSLDRYAAIDAATVAVAMAALTGENANGTFIHHNRDLLRIARMA